MYSYDRHYGIIVIAIPLQLSALMMLMTFFNKSYVTSTNYEINLFK